ncbi:MAG: hypothetical protein NZ703_02690, partial [Gemmataceae bacterium]|nr:hypothetical protein [Gemmataceae bacterium]
TRIQGCYISEAEIEAVADFWRAQESPVYLLSPTEFDLPTGGDLDEDEEEEGLRKKKAKHAKKPAVKRPVREERRRAVWVIFDNTNKRVETFPFHERAKAEAALARRLEEKKGYYYLNLVKDVIGE